MNDLLIPGIDIFAPPYDHILHPSDNLPISIFVNHCSVPAKVERGPKETIKSISVRRRTICLIASYFRLLRG